MSNPIFSFFGEVGLKTMEAEKGLLDITNKAQGTADKMKSSFSGISGGINNAISGIASGMSSTLSSVGTMASSAGESLTKYITKPALAAGTALAGIALKKGWDRLIGIDTARAKLQGLGHDAEGVDQIMNDALASVKGTAFGMAEAATTAASAVAAGIEPGKELEKYLTLVGDAAAIAGSGMDEMGSIFNKIATSGMVQADELNQISDRGIPIFQLLSETLGISVAEVREWASEGKISAEMFYEAMEEGVGGAAAIIGATSFSAALANIGASIGRIGANFLDAGGEAGGFFSQVKPLLADLNEWLGTIEDQAADLGVKLGEVFNEFLERIQEWKKQWDSLGEETQNSIKKMATSAALLAVVIGPVLKVIGTIATTGGKATKAVSAIGRSLTKLGLVASKAGGGLSAFSGVFGGLGTLANIGAIGLGVGAFGGVLATLGLVQQQFGDQLDGMFSMAQKKGPEIISGLAQGVASKLPELISLGTTLLTNFLDTITANLPALMVGGAAILGSLITGFAENLPELVGSAIQLLGSFIVGFIQALPELIAAGGALVAGLIEGFIENLPLLWEQVALIGSAIWALLSEGLGELPEALQEIIDKYKEWGEEHPILSSLLEGLVLGLGIVAAAIGAYTLATTIATMATTAFATIMAILTSPITLTIAAIVALIAIVYALWQNWEAIGPMLSDIWNNVSTAVVGIVSDMWASITNWFSEIVSSVSAKTQEAYNSVVEWFTEMKNSITEKVTDMYDSVVEWFEKIPGKIEELWGQAQSFLEGINLYDIGTSIVEGLWNGIKGKWDDMVNWVSEKASGITETLKGVFQINSPARVMIPIGSSLPEGVAVGVEKGAKFVDEALNKLGSKVTNTTFDIPEVTMASNYTFKQQPTQAQQNSNNLLEETVYLLRKILAKDTDININGRTLSEEILDDINYLNDLYNNRDTRIRGGVAYP